MTETVAASDLKPLLTAEQEIAFLDVREHGQFGEGHPFFAVNVPYSRLEVEAVRLLPHRGVRVILLDDGDGTALAQKAAARLRNLGFGDVALLKDGARGWEEAGFTLYKGVNLPSKAFGELVEHEMQTPSLTAERLQAMRDRGEPFVLLDGRAPGEYRRMTIPGAKSCPNAELGHRLGLLVNDESIPVVVNCAGRTRSIIGAQGLINLGVPNPVYALENGTQGWLLAGFELERGTEPQHFDALDGAALAASRSQGEALIKAFAIPTIDLETVARWRDDASRTLYVLDVRTAEEFAAGHLPGSAHAPGGQLVQATDQWIAVRGARIVLVDDTGLRAAQTALWLSRMGHAAFVLEADVARQTGLECGWQSAPNVLRQLPECSNAAAARLLAEGAGLLDLRPSMAFRDAHIEGARWGIRPQLEKLGLDHERAVVICGDRELAELAAIDLREQGHQRIHYLPGGVTEWRDNGFSIVASPDCPRNEDCIDYLYFVHDRHDGNHEAMRGYLEWEIGLVGQLDEQERAVFNPSF